MMQLPRLTCVQDKWYIINVIIQFNEQNLIIYNANKR